MCRISRTPVLDFAETAEKVFEHGQPWAKRLSKTARVLVDYTVMAMNLTGGCVYIVFFASTVHDICNTRFGWDMSVRIYILIVMVAFLPLGQVRSLKFLVPFSGSANVFMLVVFGIVLYYIFKEPLVISDKPLIESWTKWPIFFSTVIFALEGIGSVMPVENSMAKPQEFLGFPSVLLTSMGFVTVIYTVIGLLGYIRFGKEIKGSITLNLPTDEWTATAGQVLIALSIYFTFGIQLYVPMEILFKKIAHKIEKSRNISEIGIRNFIMILQAALAIAIPSLGPFISLMGAVFVGTLGLFVPAVLETVFLQANGNFGRLKWKLWKNMFLVIFSLVAMFSGTFVSIKDIIKLYTTDDDMP